MRLNNICVAPLREMGKLSLLQDRQKGEASKLHYENHYGLQGEAIKLPHIRLTSSDVRALVESYSIEGESCDRINTLTL